MNYLQRLTRLRAILQEQEVEGFLLINIEGSDSLNLRYLTGFAGTFGLLFVTPEKQLLLTDSRYLERARREIQGFDILELKGNWAERTAELLTELGLRRWGLNALTVSLHNFNRLREKLKDMNDKGELVLLEGPVEGLRRRKDEDEIALIKRAVELTDQAFLATLEIVSPGMSEREVAWEIEKQLRERGSDGLAFPIIVAAGPNSALPHAVPTDYRLQDNDLVLVDMGARYEGYCADMTRVLALGQPTERQREIYKIVRQAQETALAGLKPGMTGKEADALARQVIQEAGYGEHFGHGLGHGVGLAVHEGPRLSYLSEDDILEPGIVVTVEPGIYLPDEFGVRIEDLGVIREHGFEVLTGAPKELRSV